MNAPALSVQRRSGLDVAAPLEQHLSWLDAQAHDPEAYAQLFLAAFEIVGHAYVIVEEEGEHIQFGVRADEHDKERAVWMNALSEHLDATGHRHALRRLLFVRGKVCDARPRKPAGVTRAIRDYVATSGRILVTPEGELREGDSFPRGRLASDQAFADAGRATRAYHLARRWPGADRQIIRAARLVGHRTDNGWLVLEARS